MGGITGSIGRFGALKALSSLWSRGGKSKGTPGRTARSAAGDAGYVANRDQPRRKRPRTLLDSAGGEMGDSNHNRLGG